MTELDELIAEAELGEEAKKFLESDLGRCIIGMAEQEIEAAREDLENVGPTETEKIREIQNRAKVARMFEKYLVELLTRGENALDSWRHQNEQA